MTVSDDDANYQSETYFMYLVFAAIAVGLLVLGQGYLNKVHFYGMMVDMGTVAHG